MRFFPPNDGRRVAQRTRFRNVMGQQHLAMMLALVLSFAGGKPLPAQTIPATLPDLKLASPGYVTAMAVQNDGKIVIAGSFQTVNDVPRAGLARLNADGSLDAYWNPYIATAPNQPLTAIAEAGSYLYIGGGDFAVNNLQGDFREIARISTLDGTVDQTWNPRVTGGVVRSIAVADTNVYVGGTFTAVMNLARSGLARISTDDSAAVDPAWNPAPNGPVQQVALTSSNVFVAGSFSAIGTKSRSGLARLSLDTGQPDANWNPQPQSGPLAMTALLVDGTNLFVAGDFSAIDNASRNGLAKLSTEDGASLDADWNPISNLNGVSSFTIRALAKLNDSLFAAGDYNQFPFLLKATASGVGTVDPAWKNTANSNDSAKQHGSVLALEATPSGLLAGGAFARLGGTGLGGAPSLGIGRLDLVSGERDAAFHGQAQVSGAAYAVARQPDGRIIVGGSFQSAGGLARANLVRVSVSGEVDPTWSPNTDGPVYAIAAKGSDVFVGGAFTTAGGLSRTNLAKLGGGGLDGADPAWDAGIANLAGTVACLAVNSTNLFVGGNSLGGGWGTIGGQSRNCLAKLTTTSPCHTDAAWLTDATNAHIAAMALGGTNLFIGGTFTNLGLLYRTSLAKVSAVGAGNVDPAWFPLLSPTDFAPWVCALAVKDTDLFVGGSFTSINNASRSKLAKLSTTGQGDLDPLWSPAVVSDSYGGGRIVALAASGTNVYAAGDFSSIGGASIRNVARLSGSGTGAVEVAFAPNPPDYCYGLLANGNDLYVAGAFNTFGNLARDGFALQPVADAPVLIQDSATNLFIFRNPLDGPEVTHFRILSIGNFPLYLNDGKMTPLHEGDYITVAQGGAGLIFAPNAAITVASAINPTPAGTGATATTLVMGTAAEPVFTFSSPNYSVREGQGSVVVTVRKFGTNSGSVFYTTSDLTASGGVDYLAKSGTLSFSSVDKFKNIIIPVGDDFENEGDEQFEVKLFTGPNLETWSAFTLVTIVDNDIVGSVDSVTTTLAPTNLPTSTGVLTVVLDPANGQWRLQGGLGWHASGESAQGFLADDYRVEFRPLHGYKEPGATTIRILTGMTNYLTNSYEVKPPVSEVGGFRATIQPATAANARWRLQEEPAGWLPSGEDITVSAGTYILEFTNLPGWVTPPEQTVEVRAGETLAVTGFYLEAPSNSVSTTYVDFPGSATNEPFCYNGQLQTSVGFGSGFVVQPRVVLTAAHVLFDDYSLTPATDVRWFFQRYRDQFEPPPQTPRGWYVFTGYAAQRTNDMSQGVTPGYSSDESQPLDAAAIYFPEDAGRNGCYGGFLATDADANEFLLSANTKFLAGYPLDGVALTNQGRLHATVPANLLFTPLPNGIFSTTNIQGLPGNSGGPLYVQIETGKYLPAAIFLGGSHETLVRPINSEVVDLINRADRSSHGGGNSTGGGVTLISIYTTALPENKGQITIKLVPPDATHVRPGWRFVGNTGDYYTNATTTLTRTAGIRYPITYQIEFKPVPGFIAPDAYSIALLKDEVRTYEANYDPVPPILSFHPAYVLSLTGFSNATYRIESSADLSSPNWTPLTNVTLTSATLTLPGTQPAASGSRFYRAALIP